MSSYDIKHARYKVLLLAFVLLIIILAFTGSLNYMAFANNYNNSLVNTYSVAGNELVRKIEYALRYGKPIDNYYGINDTLQELKDVIKEVEQVNIVSTSGNVLYDLDGFVRDSKLPDELLKAVVFQKGALNENLSYQFYKEKVYLFLRISDNKYEHVASLAMIFPEGNFLQFNSKYTKKLIAYLGIVAVIAIVALFLVLYKTRLFTDDDNKINKKRLLLVFIIVLSLVQPLYSGLNYSLFKNAYIDMAYKSQDFIKETVTNNITSIQNKGISLQSIEGLDKYLKSIKESLPQIEEISLVDASEIKVTVSNAYIDQEMFKILLDMLTVLAISMFFMIELTLLAVILISNPRQLKEGNKDTSTSHGLIRAFIFIVNLGTCMSLTFVPIVMQNLYTPVFGLPKDVILGLPLSAEMLGGVLAIILAGWLIDKKGWRAIFYTGAIFLALGNVLAGLSESALPFILSRGIAGLGIGFILMVIRSLVVSLPETNTAIAEFGAGSIAGLNCGAVIGGMLADRVGYNFVFFLAATVVILSFFFVRSLMPGYELLERNASEISAWQKIVNFVTDRKAILFLLCIFVPFFVGGSFLDYYFPLFASNNDLSQSDISRAFLLNGLCIIYLGPLLTRCASKKLGETNGMVVSIFIVVCALATFMIFGTVTAAFITIILLGVAESFGISLKTTYFLNLKGIKDLEINKGIAYFSAMVNMSRMAGPIVYGIALSWGMRMGVGLISFTMFMLIIAFIVLNKLQPKYSSKSSNMSQSG